MAILNLLPLLISFSLVYSKPVQDGPALESRQISALPTCLAIQSAISSSSSMGWPLTPQYVGDLRHWSLSSVEVSACSVQPGSVDDLSKIVKILGQKRTQFAVKCGGHATNKGFSSTTGVLIAMSKLNQIVYHPESQNVDIGGGAIWDQVYAALEPTGRNVVGGRVSGPGVGGFILGGGYSWLSNQYGLSIDAVLGFELVLPNGTFTQVTAESNPDLFFALRGGGNNFGIVTKFTLRTFPQGQVWGGSITYLGDDKVAALVQATAKFCNNVTDPKAAIITAFVKLATAPITSVTIFYDGPEPPKGIFDDFLAIQSLTKDIKARSYLSLVKSAPSEASANLRTVFHTGSVLKYSPAVIAQIANQSEYWGKKVLLETGALVQFAVESFLPSYFNHSKGGAYLHSSSYPVFPLIGQFSWINPLSDDKFISGLKQGMQAIIDTAVAEGQDVAGQKQLQYPNYALPSAPLSEVFGPNVGRLQEVKRRYDPDNVMGLAGGFKL